MMDGIAAVGLLAESIAVFMFLLFAQAALHKLRDIAAFSGFVADYGLLPEAWSTPCSVLLVAVEMIIVVALLVPSAQAIGVVAATAMLLLYGLAMGINIARGRDRIDCGCGGAIQPITWALVARNLALAACAILAQTFAKPKLSGSEMAVALLGGLTLWAAHLLFHQILSNTARMQLAEQSAARPAPQGNAAR